MQQDQEVSFYQGTYPCKISSSINNPNYDTFQKEISFSSTTDIYFTICKILKIQIGIIFSKKKPRPVDHVAYDIGVIYLKRTPNSDQNQEKQTLIQAISRLIKELDIAACIKIFEKQTKFSEITKTFTLQNENKSIEFETPEMFREWKDRIHSNQAPDQDFRHLFEISSHSSVIPNYSESSEILPSERIIEDNENKAIYLINQLQAINSKNKFDGKESIHQFYVSWLALMGYCRINSIYFSQDLIKILQSPNNLMNQIKEQIKKEIQKPKHNQLDTSQQPNLSFPNVAQYLYQFSEIEHPGQNQNNLRRGLMNRNGQLSSLMRRNLAVNILMKTIYKFKEIEDNVKTNSLSNYLQQKLKQIHGRNFASTKIEIEDTSNFVRTLDYILQQFAKKADERSRSAARPV